MMHHIYIIYYIYIIFIFLVPIKEGSKLGYTIIYTFQIQNSGELQADDGHRNPRAGHAAPGPDPPRAHRLQVLQHDNRVCGRGHGGVQDVHTGEVDSGQDGEVDISIHLNT